MVANAVTSCQLPWAWGSVVSALPFADLGFLTLHMSPAPLLFPVTLLPATCLSLCLSTNSSLACLDMPEHQLVPWPQCVLWPSLICTLFPQSSLSAPTTWWWGNLEDRNLVSVYRKVAQRLLGSLTLGGCYGEDKVVTFGSACHMLKVSPIDIDTVE